MDRFRQLTQSFPCSVPWLFHQALRSRKTAEMRLTASHSSASCTPRWRIRGLTNYLRNFAHAMKLHYYTEWLFVRARTNRILAIRTVIDHVIIILPHAILIRALCEKWLRTADLSVNSWW